MILGSAESTSTPSPPHTHLALNFQDGSLWAGAADSTEPRQHPSGFNLGCISIACLLPPDRAQLILSFADSSRKPHVEKAHTCVTEFRGNSVLLDRGLSSASLRSSFGLVAAFHHTLSGSPFPFAFLPSPYSRSERAMWLGAWILKSDCLVLNAGFSASLAL